MIRAWLLSAVLLCGLWGCGPAAPYEGAKRVPLTGRVTFAGDPVDGGSISFIPESDSLRVAGGPIVQGQYSVNGNQGANIGKYKVQIHWSKPTGKKHYDSDTMEMVSEFKEIIPAKYNSQTELSADVIDAANEFNFDLKP